MSIAIRMPALSPTMEEGTLTRWLVKVGDKVSAGDVMAEIETDKATMEFEAVDEGVIADIAVPEGTENVKVGEVIATLAEDGEDVASVKPAKGGEAEKPSPLQGRGLGEGKSSPPQPAAPAATPVRAEPVEAQSSPSKEKRGPSTSSGRTDERVIASPLAKRIAEQKGVDLKSIKGSGPNGRIVRADVEGAKPGAAAPAAARGAAEVSDFGIPFEAEKLSNVRKVIARRLTELKQTIPHIYLTVDIRLDALLKLRGELNAALEPDGVKLSVNDLLIKALAKALLRVPQCNVQFAGDELLKFQRADISVAVSIPGGLITPIVKDAGNKSVATISTEMKNLAGRARDGKLRPEEFQGGTASLSNMGMFGIKQFEAVINPPQAMIMAIGAGEKRPFVVDGALSVATVMTATGSFDHRAIDGADGAQLMQAFQHLIEQPLGLVA